MDLEKIIPAQELDELRDTAASTEEEFGLKPGFLMGLLDDVDDWSFIIKTHAFLESAVNLLICHHLGEPGLEQPMSKIGIRQRTTLAEALHLLPRDEVKMIEELGALRNSLVHNPKNTDFSLAKHLEPAEVRRAFSAVFRVAWSQSAWGIKDEQAEQMAASQPHLAIWMAALVVALRSGTAKARKDLERAERQIGQFLINSTK